MAPFALPREMKNHIDNMVSKDVIRESNSP